VSLVEVTARGRALLAASRGRKTAWLTGRLDALSADERARLVAALDVLDTLTSDAATTDAAPPGDARP
jgi:DNA-binding MarR family transcriptional regulator